MCINESIESVIWSNYYKLEEWHCDIKLDLLLYAYERIMIFRKLSYNLVSICVLFTSVVRMHNMDHIFHLHRITCNMHEVHLYFNVYPSSIHFICLCKQILSIPTMKNRMGWLVFTIISFGWRQQLHVSVVVDDEWLWMFGVFILMIHRRCVEHFIQSALYIYFEQQNSGAIKQYYTAECD